LASAGDILSIVESAYRIDVPDADWLGGIAKACRPVIDRGFGLCVFEFRYHLGSPPDILQATMVGMPPKLAEIYPTVFRNMDPDVQRRPFDFGPCTTASQMMGLRDDFKNNDLMRRFAQTFGIYDSIWITAAEPSGWGCGMHAGRPRIAWASDATVQLWSRLGAHLSAAARLRRMRRRLEQLEVGAAVQQGEPASEPDETAEAVFTSDGEVVHCQRSAKKGATLLNLRRAVLAIERARDRRQRGSGGAALARWRGLVDGRWSLLDRFESDGRRYIVARANEPEPPPHVLLTLRERQVLGYAALGHDNKVIAYDLGIAHSTVRVLLARAASKFRVRRRRDLISAFREQSPAPTQAPRPGGPSSATTRDRG
jgi:DNA-binding CsgD family transcriptional regulator